MNKILSNQPRSIYGHVLLLLQFSLGTPPQDAALNTIDIWFGFKDLPYNYWLEGEIIELL